MSLRPAGKPGAIAAITPSLMPMSAKKVSVSVEMRPPRTVRSKSWFFISQSFLLFDKQCAARVERQADAGNDGFQFTFGFGVDAHARRADGFAGDRAALAINIFAQRQADLRLKLITNQRAIAVEGSGGARNIAGGEFFINAHQDFRKRKTGHGADRAALQLLQEIDAAQATEDTHGAARQIADTTDLLAYRRLFHLNEIDAAFAAELRDDFSLDFGSEGIRE